MELDPLSKGKQSFKYGTCIFSLYFVEGNSFIRLASNVHSIRIRRSFNPGLARPPGPCPALTEAVAVS